MNRIQQGTGPHCIVTVFCGVVVHELARILGPTVSVWHIGPSRETPAQVKQIQALRDAASVAGGELWLAGYSAGGGAVRRMLDLVDPHVAILCDGGAISLPGRPQTMPRSEYARFVELAKLGARQLIASHTYLTYTEKLPPAQGPYRSTVGTLRDLTGLPLPEPAKGQHTVTVLGSGITILSYESGEADAPAHARQVQQALPLMVREYLRPRLLGGDAGRDAVAAVVAVAGSIRAAVISAAEQVANALDGMGAAPAGYLSHGYRCSVAELVADARRCGRWHDVAAMGTTDEYSIKLGDLVISKRAGQDPRNGGTGHVERLTHVDDGDLDDDDVTIGGNESNTWIEAPLDWTNVVGIIDIDPAIGRRAVELSRAELEDGVREVPGPGAHPRIQAYHAGARRGGSELAGMPGHEREGVAVLGFKASDEIPWCASSCSWAAHAAALEVAS